MTDPEKTGVIRRQLTLFVNPRDSVIIEEIRRKYNPAQYHLIAAHVTLCREDELPEVPVLRQHLDNCDNQSISVEFGTPEEFDHGKGLLLPATGDSRDFHNLRSAILQKFIETPRLHQPHITLIHPKNGTCTKEVYDSILQYNLPDRLRFDRISLIEQHNGGAWQTQCEWSLHE